jgi:3-methylcrotonyl-CoA carboxylase beta subunit
MNERIDAKSFTLQNKISTSIDALTPKTKGLAREILSLVSCTLAYEHRIGEGGGSKASELQHMKNRLTARERLELLLDPGSDWLELGLWAAHAMYAEWGGAPAAGVVTGIGVVSGRRVMVIANVAREYTLNDCG